jgi:hypothetical protein
MTIATVRLLAADPETSDRATAIADGVTADFRVPQSPVVVNSQSVFVNGVPQILATDYTFDAPSGLATFLAGHLPAAGQEVVIPYRHTLLSDADLQALLDLEDADDRLAAAQALDIIASSEALVSKKIKLLDLQTDGPAVANALRAHAAELRRQVAEGAGSDDGGFAIAELVVDDFSARERVYAEALRE